jgi:hypothetical protein
MKPEKIDTTKMHIPESAQLRNAEEAVERRRFAVTGVLALIAIVVGGALLYYYRPFPAAFLPEPASPEESAAAAPKAQEGMSAEEESSALQSLSPSDASPTKPANQPPDTGVLSKDEYDTALDSLNASK